MNEARSADDLVFETIQRIQDIGSAGLEEMCREHPEHAELIRRRIALLERAGLLDGIASSGQAPDMPERLGEFRLQEPLGGGGMGVVYRAIQEPLGRVVALKLIRPEQLYFGSMRARFQREAGVLAELEHPGIVPVLSYGEESGIPYFAMNLLEGRTLAQRLDTLEGRAPTKLTGSDWSPPAPSGDDSAPTRLEGPRTWHEGAISLIARVARALQYVHERGVLHRDIKPSNIMVLDDGRPVLFDFGLAASERADKLTRTGSVMGSVFYMSPEQVRGEKLDERSDVYSLGVTLYEALTLRCPFREDDVLRTRQLILGGQPKPLRALNPSLPRDVETVCLKAMDVDPTRRYASAEAFARDLENILTLRPIEASPQSTASKVRRWMQRRPAAALAILLGAILILGGPLGYALVQKQARDAIEEKNTQLETALADRGASLELTLETIDEALRWLAIDAMQDVPGMDRAREQLLERASENLVALEAIGGEDPKIGSARASLWMTRGLLLSSLGRAEESTTALERAVRIQRRLVEAHPGDLELEIELARIVGNLSRNLDSVGRIEESQQRHAEELALLQGLRVRRPGDSEVALLHGVALLERAQRLADRGEVAEASTLTGEAIATLESLDVSDRAEFDRRAHLRFLSTGYQLRGLIALSAGDLATAEAEHLRALECMAPFEGARHFELDHLRLKLLVNLGALRLRAGDIVGGREVLVQARTLGERLTAEHPRQLEVAYDLGQVLGNLSMIATGEEQIILMREVARRFEELHEQQPGHDDIGLKLGNARNLLASRIAEIEPERAAGIAEEALALHEELDRRRPDRPRIRQQLNWSRRLVASLGQGEASLERHVALLEDDLAELSDDSMRILQWIDAANRVGTRLLESGDRETWSRWGQTVARLLDDCNARGDFTAAELEAIPELIDCWADHPAFR